MVRTVYVNGEYLPETEGKVSIFDRGFLFADGVYEVSAVINGKLVDYEAHMERLGLSLRVPLEHSLSCMSPADDRHCGLCSKCRERRDAFLEAGVIDPTVYANPSPRPTTGP